MKNLILSGLLLFGGIMISLRAHKTRGIILMLTLLLIVSATVFTNLYQIDLSKISRNIEEYAAFAKDYTQDIFTDADVTGILNDQLKTIYKEMIPKRKLVESQLIVLKAKRNPTDTDKREIVELETQQKTIEANYKLISTAHNKRFEDEGVDSSDQTCKILLTNPPAPAFKEISGKASTGVVNHIKFENESGIVSESGVSSDGDKFSIRCPNDTTIVAYDYILSKGFNGATKDDSVSIFGGIGPVYCSDGSRIKEKYGKNSDQSIKRRPVGLGLSTYDYIPTGFGFDDNNATLKEQITGSIKGVSSDVCGHVCTAMENACISHSFNGLDHTNGTCFFTKTPVDKTTQGVNLVDSRVYTKGQV